MDSIMQRVAKLESAYVDIQDRLLAIEEQNAALFKMEAIMQDMQKDMSLIRKNSDKMGADLKHINNHMDSIVAAANIIKLVK